MSASEGSSKKSSIAPLLETDPTAAPHRRKSDEDAATSGPSRSLRGRGKKKARTVTPEGEAIGADASGRSGTTDPDTADTADTAETPPPASTFACSKCDKIFKSAGGLEYHTKKLVCETVKAPPKGTSSKKKPPGPCPNCGKTFTSGGGYDYHVSKKVCFDLSERNLVGLACHLCGKTFTSEPGRAYHLEQRVCRSKIKKKNTKKKKKRTTDANSDDGDGDEDADAALSVDPDDMAVDTVDTVEGNVDTPRLRRRAPIRIPSADSEDDAAAESAEPAIRLPSIGTRLQFPDDDGATVKATVVGHDTTGCSCLLIYDDLDEGWADWPDKDATVIDGDLVPSLVQARIDAFTAEAKPCGVKSVGDDHAERKRKAKDLEYEEDDDDEDEEEEEEDDDLSSDDGFTVDDEEVDVEAEWGTVEPESSAPPRLRTSRPKRAAAKKVRASVTKESLVECGLPVTLTGPAVAHRAWRDAHSDAAQVHPELVSRRANAVFAEKPSGDADAGVSSIDVQYMSGDTMTNQVSLQGYMSTVLEKGQAAIANVGGPARLVEWCPPVDGSTTQHLAVVAGTSGPEVMVDQNGSTSDSVQIWRLAVGDDGSPVLQLRSKLLIKGGAVVAVRWCPGTAADAHTPLNLPRLGVLAVATGSVVQLFAVPRLDHESCVGITPVLRCVDGVVQCTALCWSTEPDHKWLYVGRADGSVAVYCVGSIGGDSDAAAVDTLVRVPVTVLDGLDGRVRAVECCPVDPGLLVVTGHDEVLQLWDVGKQECIDQICTVPMPFRRRKREVVWPTEHSGMFYVAEELSLRFLEPGIKPLLKRVTHSAGEILTATVSEWRRLVAVGSEDGAVMATFYPTGDKPMVSASSSPCKQFHLARFAAVDPEVAEVGSDGEKAPCVQLWLQDFPEYTTMNFKLSSKTLREQMRFGSIDEYWDPLQNVLQVRFCPAESLCDWVASGTAAGLLLLQCVTTTAAAAIPPT